MISWTDNTMFYQKETVEQYIENSIQSRILVSVTIHMNIGYKLNFMREFYSLRFFKDRNEWYYKVHFWKFNQYNEMWWLSYVMLPFVM